MYSPIWLLSLYSCNDLRLNYQEVLYWIPSVFRMAWRSVYKVLAFNVAAPGRDHRLVPRETLQETQRVLIERGIK